MTRTEYIQALARRAGVGTATIYRYIAGQPVKEAAKIIAANDSFGGESIPLTPSERGTNSKRYQITFIDTEDDYVFHIARATNYQGIKRAITSEMKELGLSSYDPFGQYVAYIYDTQFDPDRIAELTFSQPSDILEERGLDFDVWHDEYLTDEERAEFDGNA